MDVDVTRSQVRRTTADGLDRQAAQLAAIGGRLGGAAQVSGAQAGDDLAASALARFRERGVHSLDRTSGHLRDVAGRVRGAIDLYGQTDDVTGEGFAGLLRGAGDPAAG